MNKIKKMIMNSVRYIIAVLLATGLVVLAVTCEVDPWYRGETTIEIDTKTGKRTEIQTNTVRVTKTISKYTGKVMLPETHFIKSRAGYVILSHKTHASHGIKCADCHHKVYNPERKKICARCHYGFEGMDTLHRLCIGCHKAEKNKIEKCNQCHK